MLPLKRTFPHRERLIGLLTRDPVTCRKVELIALGVNARCRNDPNFDHWRIDKKFLEILDELISDNGYKINYVYSVLLQTLRNNDLNLTAEAVELLRDEYQTNDDGFADLCEDLQTFSFMQRRRYMEKPLLSIAGSNFSESMESFSSYSESQPKLCVSDLLLIPENSIGFGFERVFGSWIHHGPHSIVLKDPYIRKDSQIHNLKQFISFLSVKSSSESVVTVALITDWDRRDQKKSLSNKAELERKLSKVKDLIQAEFPNFQFEFEFDNEQHDRELEIDDKYMILMGRGLDYMYPSEEGLVDWTKFDTRRCRRCKIAVFTIDK